MLGKHCGCWTSQPARFQVPFCLFSTLNQNQRPPGHEIPTETPGTGRLQGVPRGTGGPSRAMKKYRKRTPAVALPFWPHWGPRIEFNGTGEQFCRKWGSLVPDVGAVRFGRCGPKRPKKNFPEFSVFFSARFRIFFKKIIGAPRSRPLRRTHNYLPRYKVLLLGLLSASIFF